MTTAHSNFHTNLWPEDVMTPLTFAFSRKFNEKISCAIVQHGNSNAIVMHLFKKAHNFPCKVTTLHLKNSEIFQIVNCELFVFVHERQCNMDLFSCLQHKMPIFDAALRTTHLLVQCKCETK